MSTSNSNAPVHGERRLAEYMIDQINTRPFNNPDKEDMMGKYGIITSGDQYNKTGVFAVTEKELANLVQGVGLSDWQTLAGVASYGDCKLSVVYEFCKEGEPIPERPGETYSKDWWRRVDTHVTPGDAAQAELTDIKRQVSIQREMDTAKANIVNARELRAEAIRRKLRRSGINTDGNGEAGKDPETEGEKATPKGKK